jgi:hypothetical protein
MSTSVDEMLAKRASEGDSNDIDAMLNARAGGASVGEPEKPAAPAQPVSAAKRFVTGLGDLEVGLGQVATHVAEGPLNLARAGIRKGLEKIGATELAGAFNPTTAAEFDQIVADRENEYQAQRQAAGQNGIDWWRIGGNVANPINFAGPAAAETAGGRIAAATGTGAAFGAASPSTHPGDFWADKVKGAIIGGATGAVLSTVTEGLTKAVQAGVSWVRKNAADRVSKEASESVSDAIAKGAAAHSGVDPKSIDLGVLKAMKVEAQEALDMGVKPSQEAIFNRALANSLPVPVPLTRGMATRDALQVAKEFSLKQIEGVGEPLVYTEQAANRALIDNLNVMGGKDAPDIVSTGEVLTGHLDKLNKTLQQRIGEAYDAVRNSAGQPASMDGKAAAQAMRASLDEQQLMAFLPKEIAGTLDDIAEGKLPLNVKTAQALDKAWSGLQSGTKSYGVSTSADRAIQQAKGALLEAPVIDAAGDESIAAYKVAKGLAKQRFDMIDESPAFKAVVNGTRDAEPENFFRKFVMGSTAREAKDLRGLVTQIDPESDRLIGRTLLGEIKAKSINGSEENGAFSQAKFSKFLDPVWQSRLRALLPDALVTNLKNLNTVAEIVQRAPVGSVPNRSGTAGTAANLVKDAMKAGAGEKLTSLASRVPGLASAMETASKGAALSRMQRGVDEAINPGVTSAALPGLGPVGRESLRLAAGATVPATTQELVRDKK